MASRQQQYHYKPASRERLEESRESAADAGGKARDSAVHLKDAAGDMAHEYAHRATDSAQSVKDMAYDAKDATKSKAANEWSESAGDATQRVKDKAGETAHSAMGKAGEAKEGTKGFVQSMSDAASDKIHRAMDASYDAAGQARDATIKAKDSTLDALHTRGKDTAMEYSAAHAKDNIAASTASTDKRPKTGDSLYDTSMPGATVDEAKQRSIMQDMAGHDAEEKTNEGKEGSKGFLKAVGGKVAGTVSSLKDTILGKTDHHHPQHDNESSTASVDPYYASSAVLDQVAAAHPHEPVAESSLQAVELNCRSD